MHFTTGIAIFAALATSASASGYYPRGETVATSAAASSTGAPASNPNDPCLCGSFSLELMQACVDENEVIDANSDKCLAVFCAPGEAVTDCVRCLDHMPGIGITYNYTDTEGNILQINKDAQCPTTTPTPTPTAAESAPTADSTGSPADMCNPSCGKVSQAILEACVEKDTGAILNGTEACQNVVCTISQDMSDCVGCLSAQNPDVLDDGQRAILNINKESTCPHTDNGGANSTNGTTPALCDSACAATCNATCAPLYPQLVELCVDEFNVFNDTEACSTALCGNLREQMVACGTCLLPLGEQVEESPSLAVQIFQTLSCFANDNDNGNATSTATREGQASGTATAKPGDSTDNNGSHNGNGNGNGGKGCKRRRRAL